MAPSSETVTTSRPSGLVTRSSDAATGSARSTKLRIKAIFFIMTKDTNFFCKKCCKYTFIYISLQV